MGLGLNCFVSYVASFISLFSLGVRHYVAEGKEKLAYSGQVRAVAEDMVYLLNACECSNEPSGSVKCGEFLD